MKATKILMAALLFGLCSLSYSQDVKVNINNQDVTTKGDCAYRINGICSTEDIGGVNVDIIFVDGITWAVFTNYNSFTVSILYEISSKYGDYVGEGFVYSHWGFYTYHTKDNYTGNLVLGKEQSKKIKLDEERRTKDPYNDKNESDHIWIYSDNSSKYSLKGIITRKLSN